jgi:hypothetical protein
METRVLVSTFIIIFLGFLIIGGCATTGKITEPTTEDTVLLVGRIRATCEDFEKMWNMNGIHTNNIEIDIRNLTTNEVTSVRSRGTDGVFYVYDPESGVYIIERLSYISHGPRGASFHLSHFLNDERTFSVEQNAVYNLGDIEWFAKCIERESKEYSKARVSSLYEVQTTHSFQKNYAEVRTWFENTYPDSTWNKMQWISVD